LNSEPDTTTPTRGTTRRLGWLARIRELAAAMLFLGAGLALLAGCATEKKQKWLSFFFDGVPAPGATTNAPAIVYDENGKPLDRAVAAQVASGPAPKPKFVAHPPYEDRKCNECHESRFSVKMKETQRQVCFACHDDFLEKAKVKHQPAENSECSECHDPHGSANPKMLVLTGQELCFKCHDETQKQISTAKVKHQPVENGECASCHNPHASEIKKLLVKPDGKLCFDCHEDLDQALSKAAFKHDPAGNGECGSCHNPHVSSEKGLLIKSRAILCLECHEEKDLAKVKAHTDAPNKACLECHDPHLGKDKFLLKAGVVSAGEKPGGAK
jgi:predicted CXXCH cytochrome family protein